MPEPEDINDGRDESRSHEAELTVVVDLSFEKRCRPCPFSELEVFVVDFKDNGDGVDDFGEPRIRGEDLLQTSFGCVVAVKLVSIFGFLAEGGAKAAPSQLLTMMVEPTEPILATS